MSEDAQQPSLPSPGPGHELLKPFEGTFRAQVTIHLGPDATTESTGTMVNSFQVGGLYLHQDYVGDPNDGPFPEFVGKGYWGYNVPAEKYEGFWIDNASTMMQIEEGVVNSAGSEWTMQGSFQHPQTGEQINKRSVITLIDNDHHRMESFFAQGDGEEMKTMEINYTRE